MLLVFSGGAGAHPGVSGRVLGAGPCAVFMVDCGPAMSPGCAPRACHPGRSGFPGVLRRLGTGVTGHLQPDSWCVEGTGDPNRLAAWGRCACVSSANRALVMNGWGANVRGADQMGALVNYGGMVRGPGVPRGRIFRQTTAAGCGRGKSWQFARRRGMHDCCRYSRAERGS